MCVEHAALIKQLHFAPGDKSEEMVVSQTITARTGQPLQ